MTSVVLYVKTIEPPTRFVEKYGKYNFGNRVCEIIVTPCDWQRILSSNLFGNYNLQLRRSLARMTKKLCCQKLSYHESLKSLLASQLIPLKMSPSVRPIRTGKVLRGTIVKL